MAKKFMYVCLGILAIVVAFHLGARYGSATIVDHSATGIIAIDNNPGQLVLLDTGEAWLCQSGQWIPYLDFNSPVPVSEIKFLASFQQFYTVSNEAWYRPNASSEWLNLGSPPGGATLTHPTTWSRVKAEFGE